ncbi:MAG: long-chain fatty acid--CoA ligase [Saprospiraceae bacterium]
MVTVTRSLLDFTRVFDVLSYQRDRYPNSKSLNDKEKSQWKASSIYVLQDKIDGMSAWLLKSGLTKGDTIIFIPMAGSTAWMILDFACQQIGLISVIVHPTLTEKEIIRIIQEADSTLVICDTSDWYEAHRTSFNSLLNSISFYHLDEHKPGYFTAFVTNQFFETQLNDIRHLSDDVLPEDTFCIMYTSGSTGQSKGVMLTHANVVHNIKAILNILPLKSSFRVLSFLPFSHIFERVSCYAYMAFGVSVYFSRSKDDFKKDFQSVRPHCCTSVPRVLEKMYEYVENKTFSSSRITRKVVDWALMIGSKFGDSASQSFYYPIQLFIARQLVLYRWRRALGNHIQFIVVGAATLRSDIGRLFTSGGIRIIEAYGMTEMAPIITINRVEPGLQKWGTVGIAIPGVELHIDKIEDKEEGEIWVRGPNLMQGYYHNSALTESVITAEGWFQTGDVGKIIENRFLQITDRKKDIFKTSSGKYIAPMPLQNLFTRSPYIERCLILGFQRPFVTALLVPNFELVEIWCEQNAVLFTSPEYMVHNIKVRALFDMDIDRLNQEVASHERVRNYVLCPQDWTVENGEMTATLKPIRDSLITHYQKAIEDMYS